MSHDCWVHPDNQFRKYELAPTPAQYWGYGPLIKAIYDETGIEFELIHTGGNCWLLEGVLETGHILNIGDADGPIYPLADHHEWARGGQSAEYQGWSILVYANEEQSSYGEYEAAVSVEAADERNIVTAVIQLLQELPRISKAGTPNT